MTAAILKSKNTKGPINIEKVLRDRFYQMIDDEGLNKLPEDVQESIFNLMRAANKIGYTNGFKKATMEGRK